MKENAICTMEEKHRDATGWPRTYTSSINQYIPQNPDSPKQAHNYVQCIAFPYSIIYVLQSPIQNYHCCMKQVGPQKT